MHDFHLLGLVFRQASFRNMIRSAKVKQQLQYFYFLVGQLERRRLVIKKTENGLCLSVSRKGREGGTPAEFFIEQRPDDLGILQRLGGMTD